MVGSLGATIDLLVIYRNEHSQTVHLVFYRPTTSPRERHKYCDAYVCLSVCL